jgi:hypothetical protein
MLMFMNPYDEVVIVDVCNHHYLLLWIFILCSVCQSAPFSAIRCFHSLINVVMPNKYREFPHPLLMCNMETLKWETQIFLYICNVKLFVGIGPHNQKNWLFYTHVFYIFVKHSKKVITL